MTFEEWKKAVDKLFMKYMHCTSDDVEDWLWFDDYLNGVSPDNAFDEWLFENYG